MKHRVLKIIICVMAVILVAVAGLDMGMNIYYQDSFPAFTWINDVYCTGKTVTEVNGELLLEVKAPVLTITDKDCNQAKLDLSEVGYTESYEEALREYLNRYSYTSLATKLSKARDIELEPVRTWDEDALYERILELPMIAKELDKPVALTIRLQDGEYTLQDDLTMRLADFLCLGYIKECVENQQYDINLAEGNCYIDYSPKDAGVTETMKLWEKVDSFLNCGIVYDMGAEQIAVDRKIVSGFISLDEAGNIILDENGEIVPNEDAMVSFVDGIVAEYNTVGKELSFEATRGETVLVPYEKYGTELNRDAEVTYFLEAFKNKACEVHIPKYKQQGYVRGKDDIGDTYIEIDMTNQMMYAYVDGKCEVETEIVTGNMKRGWDTPQGVNYVYAKQKNRILRGDNYESFVYYWMPVNKGIGIHDATWRKEFGGEIYKSNGSHGCINTPKEKMTTIYSLYEVGTPVIMFY